MYLEKFNNLYESVLKDSGLNKESSLSRIYQLINNKDCVFGIVSAFRKDLSANKNIQAELNEQRHQELKNKVRDMGYGYIELRGAYKEENSNDNNIFEKSLIIGKISRDEIIALGNFYNQDSVIWHGDGKFEMINRDNSVDNFSTETFEIEHKTVEELNKLAKEDPQKFQSLFILGSWLKKGSEFTRGQRFNFVFETIDNPSVQRGLRERKDKNSVWHNQIKFSILDNKVYF